MSRAGEVLRTISKKCIANQALGLYWQNLANKSGTATLYRDDASFASGASDGALRYRGSVGICGWFDRQKNDACAAFSPLNNRFVLNLSVLLDPAIAAIGTRADATNKRIFEVIRGIGPIDLSLDKISLPPLQNAIFPDLSSNIIPFMFFLNLSKSAVQKLRRRLYTDLIPISSLLKLSGHCWNHLYSLKFPSLLSRFT